MTLILASVSSTHTKVISPKPKAAEYEIVYKREGFKAVPGYYIVFFDKDGQEIESYRIDKDENEITVLSVSKVCNAQVDTTVFHFSCLHSLRKLTEFPLDLRFVKEKKRFFFF